MADEACRALQHVHNKVDTEQQWSRAVGCLQAMTDLQIALAWQALSSGADPVALSQYKMLFKRALRAAGRDGRWVMVDQKEEEASEARTDQKKNKDAKNTEETI